MEQNHNHEPKGIPRESRIRAVGMIARLGVTPTIVAEVDDMAMMRLLAREDAGLAVIPRIVVQDELVSGLLVEVEPLPGMEENFLAITLSRRFPNPLLATLLPGQGP